MAHFLQAKPSQAKPSQAKPSQIHLNIVFGFRVLDNSENAFFLRNQGKGVFCFYPYHLSMVYATNLTFAIRGVYEPLSQ